MERTAIGPLRIGAGHGVCCVLVTYARFPTVEWTVYLRNTGTVGSPVLSQILALDATLDVRPAREGEDAFRDAMTKLEAAGEWRRAIASGHELGNHTVHHPCTGNYTWTRYDGVALEDYDLAGIRKEMEEANDQLEKLLGVRPVAFAYPCGETYIGRGTQARSYVPLVAEVFHSGRRWLNETANAPYTSIPLRSCRCGWTTRASSGSRI